MTTPDLQGAEQRRIRKALKMVARPDSRYQYDLDCFIPDFPQSGLAADRVRTLPGYRNAKFIFATPDNALVETRARALADGKQLLVPSYGLTQGFLLVDPVTVPTGAAAYAAWLDGIEVVPVV